MKQAEVAVEIVGAVLVVAFLWFIWPPLVLLGAGLACIVWANLPRPSAPTDEQDGTTEP